MKKSILGCLLCLLVTTSASGSGAPSATCRPNERPQLLEEMLQSIDDPGGVRLCRRLYRERYGDEDLETNLLRIVRASCTNGTPTWNHGDYGLVVRAIQELRTCGSSRSLPMLREIILNRDASRSLRSESFVSYLASSRLDDASFSLIGEVVGIDTASTNDLIHPAVLYRTIMDQCRRQNPPPATTNRLVAFFTAARAMEERFPHRVDAALCELSPAYRRSPERAQYVRECLAKGPSTGSVHDYFKKAEAELGAALTNHVGQAVSGPVPAGSDRENRHSASE